MDKRHVFMTGTKLKHSVIFILTIICYNNGGFGCYDA